MTAASPLAFPGARQLAGWWRLLAQRQPQAVWVGHLLLHHVEALVRVVHPRTLDRFHALVLQALTHSPDRTAPGVDRALHLGPQVLHRLLHGLAAEDLAAVGPGGEWAPTD